MIPTRMNPLGRNPYKQAVNYLESIGSTTVIDTGIMMPSAPFQIEWIADLGTLAWGRVPFGSQSTVNGEWQAGGYLFDYGSGNGYIYIGHKNASVSVSTGRKECVLTFTGSAASYLVDGVTELTLSDVSYPAQQNNIFLFCNNYNNNLERFAEGVRIYRWKCTVNGQLLRDLIPVLDWSNVPCFFDNVSGALFRNARTGTFVYG